MHVQSQSAEYSALILDEAVKEGDALFEVTGELTTEPTRTSVQVGVTQHVDVPVEARSDVARRQVESPWAFLNHACEPTVRLDGTTVRALRDLDAGSELTFHYETNEAVMAEPFQCGCGKCDGRTVSGFAKLPGDMQQQLAQRFGVSPHLQHS
jgi:hypothetical protein